MKKTLFPGKRSLNTSFFFLLALSIVLMLLDGNVSWIKPVRSTLAMVVHPVRIIVDLPTSAASRISTAFESRSNLRNRNKKLTQENRKTQQQLMQYESMKAENIRLRGLLGTSEKIAYQTLSARILAVNIDPFQQQVAINAGSNKNIKPGTPFVDSKGVMGQITQVYPLYSIGILISDSNHALPVQLLRNGLRSIATGTGQQGKLELLYLPPNSDIKQGDLLVTSGLGLKFPPDYPVATVETISHQPGSPFAHIEAKPLARLDNSREILLILSDENTSFIDADSIRKKMEGAR